MQHTEKMIEARDELMNRGHEAFVTNLASPFIGKSDEEKELIKIDQKIIMMLFENSGDLCRDLMLFWL